jgi:hypothetical protein
MDHALDVVIKDIKRALHGCLDYERELGWVLSIEVLLINHALEDMLCSLAWLWIYNLICHIIDCNAEGIFIEHDVKIGYNDARVISDLHIEH